jgi:CRISPR-associated endonuclease/helicase Cas3
VVVFNPPTPPPPGLLRKAESKAREVLSGRQDPHLDPALFSKYFDLLYRQGVNSLDKHTILDLLGTDSHKMDFQFRTAAELFRLVDESGYCPVLVDWGKGRELIEELRRWGAERLRMRRVQRFLVNVPARQLRKLQASSDVEEILPGLFGVAKSGLYDAELGLRTDGREYEPGEFIC